MNIVWRRHIEQQQDVERRTRVRAVLLIAAYCSTVPLANWALGNVGWCSDQGPCVIPVWWGLWAPSGVLWAGLALTLRDLVQERAGRRWTVAAILVGAVLSLAVAEPFVAVASATAFLVSELADFAVYSPLRRRGFLRAVVASNVVGSVVDSALFLLVAGFPLALLAGLVVGKWAMTLPVLVLVVLARRSGWRSAHA